MSKEKIILLSRISIFIIFFWFGVIKILGLSPAEELVKQLFDVSLSQSKLISFQNFLIILGSIECIIGILWLIPKWTKFAFIILSIQMFTTFGPLVLLPSVAWNTALVPTLIGQYIIKNIGIIALALNIFVFEKEKLVNTIPADR